MSDHRQKLQLVRKYLEDQFAGYRIERVDSPASDVPGFTVEKDGRRYQLQIDADVFDRYSAEELPTTLQQWNVREELCRAEGLPIVLTDRGIRLASSN